MYKLEPKLSPDLSPWELLTNILRKKWTFWEYFISLNGCNTIYSWKGWQLTIQLRLELQAKTSTQSYHAGRIIPSTSYACPFPKKNTPYLFIPTAQQFSPLHHYCQLLFTHPLYCLTLLFYKKSMTKEKVNWWPKNYMIAAQLSFSWYTIPECNFKQRNKTIWNERLPGIITLTS